ncbi:hypothetical protein PAE0294a [Pyrobaculum aerophilum str. IM2]|uniref:Uncharacterized protein n=1 Tax=Pyrobaculum aerophilum (strain ATCC 51768 / DSM 7523 / JCM 9630 / CIP 104966 / NBRC 100827 / IM2) TaxID=178306 RepID=Q8ZZF0_PYRAE|nr:hypothetical protein PAE0294a [Pyrobaculum aerophilum str. IM2]
MSEAKASIIMAIVTTAVVALDNAVASLRKL